MFIVLTVNHNSLRLIMHDTMLPVCLILVTETPRPSRSRRASLMWRNILGRCASFLQRTYVKQHDWGTRLTCWSERLASTQTWRHPTWKMDSRILQISLPKFKTTEMPRCVHKSYINYLYRVKTRIVPILQGNGQKYSHDDWRNCLPFHYQTSVVLDKHMVTNKERQANCH